MLLTVNLDSDGLGIVNREGRHLKIVAAAGPLQVQAHSAAGDKPILTSQMRAPMAVDIGTTANRLIIRGEPSSVVEIWYGAMELEYLQLVAVGATSGNIQRKMAFPGITRLLDAKPRVKARLMPYADIEVTTNPAATAGWPIAAMEKETAETSGELYIVGKSPAFDYTSIPTSAALWMDTVTHSNGGWDSMGTDFFFNGCFYQSQGSNANYSKFDQSGFVKSYSWVGSKPVVFAQKLWRVSADNQAVLLLSSVDGESWLIEKTWNGSDPQFNALWTALSNSSKAWLIAQPGEWAVFRKTNISSPTSVAINLLTGQALISPTPQNGGYFYYWPKIGKWLEIKNDGGAHTHGLWVDGEKVRNSVLSPMFTEFGDFYFAVSSTLREMQTDFTAPTVISSGVANTSMRYLRGSGGVLFYNALQGRILYYKKDMFEGSVDISGIGVSYPQLDTENSKIILREGQGGSTWRLMELDAPELPVFEPIAVDVWEFFA